MAVEAMVAVAEATVVVAMVLVVAARAMAVEAMVVAAMASVAEAREEAVMVWEEAAKALVAEVTATAGYRSHCSTRSEHHDHNRTRSTCHSAAQPLYTSGYHEPHTPSPPHRA